MKYSDKEQRHIKVSGGGVKQNRSHSRTDESAQGVYITFCSVDSLCGISGGERYDARLRESIFDDKEYHAEELTLYPSEDGIKRSKNLPLMSKLAAPIYGFIKVLQKRREIKGIRRKDSVWHFNTSKCLYFLPALMALKLLGNRCIGFTHHFMYLQMRGWKRVIYRAAELFFIRMLDEAVAPSPFTRDMLLRHFPKKNIPLLHIPFSHSEIAVTPASMRKRHSMLYIGTVEYRKGLHILLESMEIMRERGKEMQLTIAGHIAEEPYATLIRERAERKGLNVKFTGFLDEAEKQRLMQEAEMFVFPSQAEGYGMVLVEAMQAGLPIVAFRNTSIPYIIGDNERGVMCENGDARAMADAIIRLENDVLLRDRLSSRGKEYAASLPGMNRFNRDWRLILCASKRASSVCGSIL